MEEEVDAVMTEMSAHVVAQGGFPKMSVDYDELWCSDGRAACMMEFLVRKVAELQIRVKELGGT